MPRIGLGKRQRKGTSARPTSNLLVAVTLWATVVGGRLACAEESGFMTVAAPVGAAIVNVVPVTSAFAAKPCLQGYILCKATFALISLIVAAEETVLAGAGKSSQARGVLHRGFGGDWVVTPAHIAGRDTVEVLPAPAPSGGAGTPAFP